MLKMMQMGENHLNASKKKIKRKKIKETYV